uniref:Nicotine oxidoreductase n=1 Tax=Haematococcus lacustris TaxID=44745 RepID=A0A2K9YRY6_HAELA|nr:nicotine oxidoreductase [Haematococcus lacustris]AUW36498.1 nicotine oxidoreductase [Haematococcus lacustris]
MFMKGFCDRKGNPQSLGWLTTYEPHIIVERFNSVITGLCEYYTDFISYPSALNRWVYILRWSAIKTLAHKFHKKIRKILRQFTSPEGKFCVPYFIQAKQKDGRPMTLRKVWTLLSQKDAIGKSRKGAHIPISQKLKAISKGEFVFTVSKGISSPHHGSRIFR